MVKVRDEVPRLEDGRIDVRAWTRGLAQEHRRLDRDRLLQACEFVESLPHRGAIYLENGMELAELVADLEMDTSSVVAALAYRPVRTEDVEIGEIEEVMGTDVAHLLREVTRMATASILEMSDARLQTSERRNQVENVRRMLVALINDARVAVLKIAERVVALRAAKGASEARRQRIAREAHLIFAPLANRLGVWQLKWELEDLALRYLVPDAYMAIAKQLDGRRAERERRVAEIAAALQTQLRAQGIQASVSGRAKHIYSIWRKMQAKKVGIDRVHDVRAVRVLVENIAECYATLGVIHTQWRHIPSEFDDYIAAPKDNGYRSIHTAVIGPDELTLEVQIRTREMHQEAELGVCAHWAYKEGETDDRPYAEKMNWLRQVVEVGNGAASTELDEELFGEELQQLFQEDRIFVYTPAGHVVDLTSGATSLDFAYRVHTEVGHRCRGALVDGEPFPLDRALETGQQVQILTAEDAEPRPEWLEPHLGFVNTTRARQKVLEWFRARGPSVNRVEGERRTLRMLRDLGVVLPREAEWSAAAQRLGFADKATMMAAVGSGDLSALQLLESLLDDSLMDRQLSLIPGVEDEPARVCRLLVEAPDREGLLLDIAKLLSERRIPLLANSGGIDRRTGRAIISLEIPFPGLGELAVILARLQNVEGVAAARRLPD